MKGSGILFVYFISALVAVVLFLSSSSTFFGIAGTAKGTMTNVNTFALRMKSSIFPGGVVTIPEGVETYIGPCPPRYSGEFNNLDEDEQEVVENRCERGIGIVCAFYKMTVGSQELYNFKACFPIVYRPDKEYRFEGLEPRVMYVEIVEGRTIRLVETQS